MFKRATWLGVGFTLGVGTTVVAARKARQQLERYKPNAMVDRVTTTLTDRASNLRDQVSAALDDGKQAAKDREQELRTDRFDRVTQTKTVETQTVELHTPHPPSPNS
ncbi:MAG: hypothetical protein QOF40_2197 [Actinomycetota bacterium]|nr:hypothetical protein [Actinomycetota bacterium]